MKGKRVNNTDLTSGHLKKVKSRIKKCNYNVVSIQYLDVEIICFIYEEKKWEILTGANGKNSD